MKVLIVSTNLSHPTDAGNRAAIMGQVQLLKHLGCDVHFLFADMSLRPVDDSYMRQYWGENFHIFKMCKFGKLRRLLLDVIRPRFFNGYWKRDDHYPLGLSGFVNQLQKTQHFDAVIIQYMRLSKLLPQIDIPRKAIYTHDVFSYKDIRVGEPFYETCNAHEEAMALQRCPNIFAIQEEEAIYYRFLTPQSRIFTVYNHYDYTETPVCHNKNILYLASRMEFNINGIVWFLDNVWQQFVKLIPDAKLLLAGTVCERIDGNKYPNLELLGRVDSLEDFYQKGDVVINPVYQGTGLKIKTFEALAFGKTTIVHPHSTTGIYKREVAPLIVAEKPEEWIKRLCEVFSGQISVDVQKEKAKEYILDMDSYIDSQYKAFLE